MSAKSETRENVQKASIKNLPKDQKQEMVECAKTATARGGESDFWKEVENRMNTRERHEAEKVTPRPKK